MNALFSPLASISRHELVGAIAARIEAHADAMEALIAILNALEGDSDMEPTLGAPEAKINPPWGPGFLFKLEGSQLHWAGGSHTLSADDCEVANEDGGDILDGPELSEPTLGGSEVFA